VIKLVVLLKRRPELTLEEFCARYEQEHAPLAARTIPPEVSAGIVSYVQNHALRFDGSTTEPAYDCVTEFSFRDLDALRRWAAWYGGPGGKVLRDDEERFMLTVERVVIATETRNVSLHA
jgi:hypothetical protein